jgi:WD40 repeat protein
MEAINLEGHNNPIYAVVAHPSQSLCYTAGNDKGIVEWDTNSQQFSRLFAPITHTVYALEIVVAHHLLVAGCNNGDILFFDTNSTLIQFKIAVGSPIFCIKYLATKKELVVSTDAGEIIVVNIVDQKIVHRFASGNQKIRCFDYNIAVNMLATASNDYKVRLYRLDDYTFINSFEAHTMGVGAIVFSANGQILLTGSRDAHLKVWDTQTWICQATIAAHLFAIYAIVFHPVLPYFATCSRDKSIKIWRSNDYTLYKNSSIDKGINGHRLSVNQICWLTSGQKLLSVSDDKTVKMWVFK